MTKKIALIGSAPSSVALAPYDDPSWEIWACSPGSRPHLKRCDAFFELHKWEPHQSWFAKEYVEFLAAFRGPVYTAEMIPTFPTATLYPKEEMVEKYGPYFFTSSLSWMFALAMESGATEIGMWGIDMSAQEEWFFQRSGCHFFIWEAKRRGITVTIPPQSDLLRPPPLYGFCEQDPMHAKLFARAAELDHRIAVATHNANAANQEIMYLRGAREDLEYILKTWVADTQAIARTAWTLPTPEPSPQFFQPMINTAGDVAGEMKARAGVSDRMNAFIKNAAAVELNTQPAELGKMPETMTWSSTPAIPLGNGLGA